MLTQNQPQIPAALEPAASGDESIRRDLTRAAYQAFFALSNLSLRPVAQCPIWSLEHPHIVNNVTTPEQAPAPQSNNQTTGFYICATK